MKLALHPRAPQTLADQLFAAGVEFPCGGESACGGCKVRVLEGEVPVTAGMRDALSEQEIRDGWRLACRALSAGSVVVEVEQWSLPVLTDEARVPPLEPMDPRPGRGAVIDLGTTTLVVQVADLTSGEVLGVEQAPKRDERVGPAVPGGRKAHGLEVEHPPEYVVGAVPRVRAAERIRLIGGDHRLAAATDDHAGERRAIEAHFSARTPVRALNSSIISSKRVTTERVSSQ